MRIPELTKNYTLSEQLIKKNNRELHGLVVRGRNTRVAPVFYYEDFYEAYKKGTSIDDCIGKIIQFMNTNKMPDEDFGDFLSSWKRVKDHLIVKLICRKTNHNMLKETPFRVFGDMAVIAQIYVDNEALGKGAVTVDLPLVSHWNISVSELFDTALENMLKYHVRFINLMDCARAEDEERRKEEEVPKIYVTTFDESFCGAASMLRTDELISFAKKQDKDFYVLPVSVHEVLLIEKLDEVDPNLIKSMLESINSDHAANDEILSEQIFVLDRNDKYLRSGEDGKTVCIVG